MAVVLHQIDSLLQFVQVLFQHGTIFKAIDKVAEVLHILGQSSHPIWVNVSDLW